MSGAFNLQHYYTVITVYVCNSGKSRVQNNNSNFIFIGCEVKMEHHLLKKS